MGRPEIEADLIAKMNRKPLKIEATADNVWPEWPPKNTSEPR